MSATDLASSIDVSCVIDPICEAEWWFDVDFDVMCTRPPGHDGAHEAHVVGNGDVPATVTWGGDPA